MILGYWIVEQLALLSAGQLECFYQIGAYQLCNTTEYLSIYTSLFLLVTQALISRILVPGMSNFVNASVSFRSACLLFEETLLCMLVYMRYVTANVRF